MRSLLIVDDDARFRALAQRILSPRFEIVAGAADCASARQAVARLRPDAVLLDVTLPDGSGFQLAAELNELEEPPDVVLTSTEDLFGADGLLAASSARGFISKASLTAEILAQLLD